MLHVSINRENPLNGERWGWALFGTRAWMSPPQKSPLPAMNDELSGQKEVWRERDRQTDTDRQRRPLLVARWKAFYFFVVYILWSFNILCTVLASPCCEIEETTNKLRKICLIYVLCESEYDERLEKTSIDRANFSWIGKPKRWFKRFVRFWVSVQVISRWRAGVVYRQWKALNSVDGQWESHDWQVSGFSTVHTCNLLNV